MATWIRFAERATGKEFYAINTHYDHVSEEARTNSSALIKEQIDTFEDGLSVLLFGDFNSTNVDQSHHSLVAEGPFEDLYDTAKMINGKELGTFNNFRDPTGGGKNNRIDWILAAGPVEAKTIEIDDTRENGYYLSDHYPVVANVKIR